ncbi:helix-turn-helix transcriptional regulator [Mesonia sp. K7]|uniref:helix-turn-helix domain-containing protein n=1 Tax=Mesonia sp. K7 TaxID=2218606 RepID=UPI000DAAC709|nr:helix-turn-helix transcriptional regulator [Mesonia sp. K7]PZD78183.1 hypothetical protein DNG35_05630 [Mesonia sp. K7]
MNLLSEQITESRKAKGLTQEELAALAKVNLRTIQRLENNENIPRAKTLQLVGNALEIDLINEIGSSENKMEFYFTKVMNVIFFIILNIVIIMALGYLTIDSAANTNSRIGAFLLSLFIPYFIVRQTEHMNSMERFLKLGSGLILYFLLFFVLHGFPAGFTSGLFVCIPIFISILFYGNKLNLSSLLKI